MEKTYDVVVFGATGFAGKLVAEYLAEHYLDSGLRWAIAGRSERKLAEVRDELAARWPHMAQVPLVVADSGDRASLDRMASLSRVVCTTVGPYAKYGSEVVAACIAQRADYVDLTGEVQWIKRMIDAHHNDALRAQTRIVTCCGFDSIPSDLGVWALQDWAKRELGAPCDEVSFQLWWAKGGFSGGTVASLLNVLKEAASDESVRRVLVDPYSLLPEDAARGPRVKPQQGPRETPQGWTAPFLMAPINERIVRRSNALLGAAYGSNFIYSEAVRAGSGASGMVSAAVMSAGMGVLTAALMFAPTRALLEAFVLPAPGEGPSRRSIERGGFEVRLFGKSAGRQVARAKVVGKRDPGYGATATMLAESALCLALDLPRSEQTWGGVLTPASAMGGALVSRLKAAGMRFEVEAAG